MRGSLRIALAAVWLGWMAGSTGLPLQAQDLAPATATVVPHVVQYSGTLGRTVAGSATVGGSEEITAPVPMRFALYAAQTGGEPVWAETQTVTPDSKGRYTVLLGSATPSGLPQAVFNSGDAKWLGIAVGQGEEQPRTVLVATPYSLKASDAETVGGHPASDFKMVAKDANGKPDTTLVDITQINTSQGILGAGTGPTVSLSLDPVYFQQLAANFPIKAYANTFTNTNTFTVPIVFASTQTFPGTASLTALNTFKAAQFLGATGTATSSKAYNSNGLVFQGSAYNSTASAAEAINFGWQSEPTLNNTSAPAGTMNLLYSTGSNALAETGLSIASTGKINFVSGQTFPGTGAGTITGITTSSPLSGSGTSGSVALSLNTSSLETTLNSVYPQLGAANTFTSAQTISGANGSAELSVTDSSTSTSSVAISASGQTGVLGTGNATTGAGVSGSGLVGLKGTGSPSTIGTLLNYSTYGIGTYSTGVFGVFGESLYTGSTDNPIGVFGYIPSTVTGSVANGIQTAAVAGITAGVNGVGGLFAAEGGDANSLGLGATGYTGAEISGQTLGLSVSGSTAITATSNASTKDGTAIVATGGSTYTASTSAIGTGISASGYYGVNATGTAVGVSASAPAFGVYGMSVGGVGTVGVGSTYGMAAVSDGSVLPSWGFQGGVADGISTEGSSYSADSSAGVWGDFINNEGDGSGLLGSADLASAIIGVNNSSSPTMFLNNYTTATHNTIFETNSPNTYSGARHCTIDTSANLACTGQLSGSNLAAVVPVEGGKQSAMYSVQSPENWFEDFGSGSLQSGATHVELEPAFAQTVNTGVEYHVFLTPNGDCKGLYVANKTASGFEVRELGGGTSSVAFDYRIVVKRKGYETVRMEDMTDILIGQRERAAHEAAMHPQGRINPHAHALPDAAHRPHPAPVPAHALPRLAVPGAVRPGRTVPRLAGPAAAALELPKQ